MFTKKQKKIARKLKYCEELLLKNEKMSFSKHPTCSLFIGNGGLECGLTREKLLEVFIAHGQVKNIVMLPRKSYSFVVFSSINEASNAIAHVNGLVLSVSSTLYLSFVTDQDVPSELFLFQELPAGLILLKDFVTEEEEKELLNSIDITENCNDKYLLKHRKVKHYGYEFLYGSNNIDKSQPLEKKIPKVCFPLLKKLVSLKYIPRIPEQLTVNHYLPGQGIPPHVDTHSAFEDGIISLSLSSQVVMNFYHPKGKTVSVLLPRRSVLIMLGESRYLWKHGIPSRKLDIVTDESSGHLTLLSRSPRTSLTFRLIRDGACSCDYKDQCDSQLR